MGFNRLSIIRQHESINGASAESPLVGCEMEKDCYELMLSIHNKTNRKNISKNHIATDSISPLPSSLKSPNVERGARQR